MRLKLMMCVGALSALLMAPTVAQEEAAPHAPCETGWMKTSAVVFLTQRTQEEAEFLAKQAAMTRAIELACDQEVVDYRHYIQIESDEEYRETFVRVNRIHTNGRVTKIRHPETKVAGEMLPIKEERPSSDPTTEHGETGIGWEFEAWVEPSGDPYFTVDAELNRPSFVEGDLLTVNVRSSRAGYLTLFNIESNRGITVTIPSYGAETRDVKANDWTLFPHTGDPGQLAPNTGGKDRVTEQFMVVVTKREVAPPKRPDGEKLALLEVIEWTARIPADDIASDIVTFDISKK